MKKIFTTVICFIVFTIAAQAQPNIYGLTSQGGSNNGGTILGYKEGVGPATAIKNFDNPDGTSPFGSLVQATDGNFYGMTEFGGVNSVGTIFSWNPSSSVYKVLYNFNNSDGNFPEGSLIQATDGNLYGMTQAGGSGTSGQGVIFSFNPTTSTYTVLHNFNGSDGDEPYGSLMQASDGNLYGMTSSGGGNIQGVIFSWNPNSSTYNVLYNFDGTNGGDPWGDLTQATDGNLYGMTEEGGSSTDGVIFSWNLSSSTYAVLENFNGTNGNGPVGNLIQANDGNLYGMTAGGGENGVGVLFSWNLSSANYSLLYQFAPNTGFSPTGSLMQATDGNLYGLTSGSGVVNDDSGGGGVIFSWTISSSTYSMLYDFPGFNSDPASPNIIINGLSPRGNLMQASNGNLYGMTSSGGVSNFGGNGVLFSYNPTGSSFAVVRSFGTNVSGNMPSGQLLKASNNNFYGTTSAGGSNGYGAIYSFNPSNSTYSVLYNFNYGLTYYPGVGAFMFAPNGASPFGGLIQGTDGNLYGMTSGGGSYVPGQSASGYGVLYSFNPTTSAYTIINNFNYTGGAYPYGGLVQASDGNLYGLTSEGGANGDGVIFSYNLSTSTYTVLYSFSGTDGQFPYGNLIQAVDGNLYGLTSSGGNGNGVLFSWNIATSSFKQVYNFDGTNGGDPQGSLYQATDGNLYGTTYNGGSGSVGVVFSWNLNTSTYTDLENFDGTNGSNPEGSLIQAIDPSLYGSTYLGGASNDGVIFSLDPSTSAFAKVADLSAATGTNPEYGSSFLEVTPLATGTITTTPLNNASYCQGTPVQVSYTISGTFNSGNTFTAQLSDATGNFSSPVSIGNTSATVAGNISGTIPANAVAGSAYRIRVVSSNPAITGADNGTNLTINAIPTVIITNPAAACAPGTVDLTATGITTGSDIGLTYTYFTDSKATLPLSNPAAVAVEGTYYIEGTNANTGCLSIQPVKVTITQPPTINSVNVTQPTCSTPTGTITINATGSGTIEYSDNGSTWTTSNTFPGLVAGLSYPIYVGLQGNTACQTPYSNNPVMINTVPNAPSVTAGSYGPVCSSGGLVVLGGSPAGGVWTGTGVSGNQSSGYTFNPSAGTQMLTYTYTNAGGCSGANQTTISVINGTSLSSIVYTGSTSVCGGTSASLSDVTGGGAWSSSASSVATVSTKGVVSFSIVKSTTPVTIKYTVTSGGCSASASLIFTVNPPLTLSKITGTNTVCVNAMTSLSNATSGGTWSSNNTAIATVSQTGAVTGIKAGNSYITYTKSAGGCSTTVSILVTVLNIPSVSAISGNNILIVGSKTQLNDKTIGGVWTSSKTTIATVNGSGVVTGISAGAATINYKISNSSGCSATASFGLTVYNPLKVTVTASKILCSGGTSTVNAVVTGGSGQYQYSLNGGKFQASNTFVEPAGVYTITIEDAIDAQKVIEVFTIAQPSALKLSLLSVTNASSGSANGSFTVFGSGGTAPYEYSINSSTYQAAGTFKNLAAAAYKVSIKDANQCSILNALSVTISSITKKEAIVADSISETVTDATTSENDEIEARVLPNPSQSNFTLLLKSNANQTIEVVVINMLGQPVYHARGPVNGTYQFGAQFAGGVYIIEVLHRLGLKLLKIVKQ